MMLDSDNVTADMTYFDFAGFHDTTSGGLQIKRKYHLHPAGDVLWVFVEPGNVVP